MDALGNLIVSNRIGTNSSGTASLANSGDGILAVSTLQTTIGGASAGLGNLITGATGGSLGAVVIDGGGSALIAGNFVGTNLTGTAALASSGIGVLLSNSTGNTVGGLSAGARNLISGDSTGLEITGGATANLVVGNYFGLNASGSATISGGSGGDVLLLDVSGNTIGGTASGAGNVISGALASGVILSGGSANSVLGNKIGTDATGEVALGNAGDGVLVSSSSSNTIGGYTAAAKNLISGNLGDGIHVLGSTISGGASAFNVIVGNCVGLDATGTAALANHLDGILLEGATGTVVGGPSSAQGVNVVSGNLGNGIHILAGSGNLVQFNLIGLSKDGKSSIANGNTMTGLGDGLLIDNSPSNTLSGNTVGGFVEAAIAIMGAGSTGNVLINNVSGMVITGNGLDGILLDGASGNTIGGSSGTANVFSGNVRDGIRIQGGSSNNLIVGNLVGLAADGKTASPNGVDGIYLEASSGNTIGGTVTGSADYISGNLGYGIHLFGTGATGNVILGDFIGTNVAGTAAVPNGLGGVFLDGAPNNTVGGAGTGGGNLISGNGQVGVYLLGAGASGDLVIGNRIGLAGTGSAFLPNTGPGVLIDGATGATVGGVGTAGNSISGNSGDGIHLLDGATGDLILGDVILSNGQAGIDLDHVTNDSVGAAVAGNTISGNAGSGVLVNAGSNHLIVGNRIGTDGVAILAGGNGVAGVFLIGTGGVTLGGTTQATQNVISGNVSDGVVVSGATSGNLILGDLIGLDRSGTLALPNGGNGVTLLNSSGTTIGGTAVGSAVVISGNTGAGVSISGGSANVLLGDFVGTNSSGTSPLGNHEDGIDLLSTTSNTLGGLTSASRNIISGNLHSGVNVSLGGSNVLVGNFIGLDINGGGAVANGSDGVVLNDAGQTTVGGLVAGARNVISGNLGDGVRITGGSNNVIAGNFIGTNAGGSTKVPNTGNGLAILDSPGNTIGGSIPAAANVLSGNSLSGLTIDGGLSGSTGDQIIGNLVGTDSTGSYGVANGQFGAVLTNVSAVTVGGTAAGLGNVFSGNSLAGLEIVGGVLDPSSGLVSGNVVVQGNYLGVNLGGTAVAPNSGDGLLISGSAANTIGGTAPGSRNVISGNLGNGVEILGPNASNNLILGDLIGTDLTGLAALANTGDGVLITHALGTTIGGLSASARDVISGNLKAGIELQTSGSTLIVGNYLGLNASGAAGLPNSGDGVKLSNSPNNVVGGPAGAGNAISGNLGAGVEIVGSLSSGNSIDGNLIGTDQAGASSVANVGDGVLITGSAGNTIGGTSGNVISGNLSNGIEVSGVVSGGETIVGNLVGLAAGGVTSLGNNRDGVLVIGSSGVTIGGTAPGSGNAVSGNNAEGIHVLGGLGNLLVGNFLGTDRQALGTKLGNARDGVLIESSSSNTIGGTTAGARNVIVSNVLDGVNVLATNATAANLIVGNYIGVGADGLTAAGNGKDGIAVNGAIGTTIGGMGASGNVISASGGSGVHLSTASSVLVLGNWIGTDSTGTVALGNRGDGVLEDGTTGATIGGLAASNTISASGGDGVHLVGGSNLLILGNLIGSTGSITSKGNAADGVAIEGAASSVTIGGTVAGSANVIGLNAGDGIHATSASQVVILGNFVGISPTDAKLGNSADGILLDGVGQVTVGGTTAASANIVGFNGISGIHVANASPTAGLGNLIEGNLVGTNGAGTAAAANSQDGILIDKSSHQTVGGTALGAGNLVSGNVAVGVHVLGSSVGNNAILGNTIGLSRVTTALGNGLSGVLIEASNANTIGGTASGSANVIAGNGESGVQVKTSVSGATGNLIVGNFLGTDANGDSGIGNGLDGVFLNQVLNVTVGGTAAGSANIISGNLRNGVYVFDTQGKISAGNLILGNKIGLDSSGTALGNGADGVRVENANGTTVGGLVLGAQNVISGNTGNGVSVIGQFVTIESIVGDRIGTNEAGTSAIPNSLDGILISQASGVTVGGTTAAASVLISGNFANGVEITNGASGNLIAGDTIGLNLAGSPLGNLRDGVLISGQNTRGNSLGGSGVGSAVVIAGNLGNGVEINLGASANLVAGDRIGTDLLGTTGLGNSLAGVVVSGLGTVSNTIGGAASLGNTISGNASSGVAILSGASATAVVGSLIELSGTGASPADGVLISGASYNTIGGGVGLANTIVLNTGSGVNLSAQAGNNLIVGDFIGTDPASTPNLGNLADGVSLSGAVSNTIGGISAVDRVYIVGNQKVGIDLLSASSSNRILGDWIGVAPDGQGMGNLLSGVNIASSESNTIGGTEAGASNVISANFENGVEVAGGGKIGNVLVGNLIGTDASGAAGLGNQLDGVLFGGGARNTLGGTGSAANTISGNLGNGVDLLGGAASNNIIGNLIGFASGHALGNAGNGVLVTGAATGNVIGTADLGNTIVASGMNGIQIDGSSSNNFVEGDYIGTDASGRTNLGNSLSGVLVLNSSGNVIGLGASVTANSLGLGNVIAGNLKDGVTLGVGANGTTVSGNAIGRTLGGIDLSNAGDGLSIAGDNTQATGNLVVANGLDGVLVMGLNNTIGGRAGSSAQTIARNLGAGVHLQNTTASKNLVLNDLIASNLAQGVFFQDAPGNSVVGDTITANATGGVLLQDASGNTIGGAIAGLANLILNNTGTGVAISGSLASANLVQGNTIQGSTGDGLAINAGSANTIGGLASRTVLGGNLVVASGNDGIHLLNLATSNDLFGNTIGGKAGLANLANGLEIADSKSNEVGLANGMGNVIIGNSLGGILITGTSSQNSLFANAIGTDFAGNAGLGNGGDGVQILSATTNLIGSAGQGNTIAGNTGAGVHVLNGTVSGSVSVSNVIQGNLIGLGGAVTRQTLGILLDDATGNLIGGASAGAGNTIGFSQAAGIEIFGIAASIGSGNVVQGNAIGTDGKGARSNGGDGVLILGASGNTIGGPAGVGNTIAFNALTGVHVTNGTISGSLGNVIQGNLIGLAGSPVQTVGVFLDDAAGNTVGGTATKAGNTIGFSQADGVQIVGSISSGNVLLGNQIGASAGSTVGANGASGVLIDGASNNTIGGSATGSANVIASNATFGIRIHAGTANLVASNAIGMPATGGNGRDGVFLDSASGNMIGGGAGFGNVVLNNLGSGVLIGASSSGNSVSGNYIGADANTVVSGNAGDGVTIDGPGNLVGGSSVGFGNVIVGNLGNGVHLAGASASGNVVAGNLIGTNASGKAGVGNLLDGILLESASSNTIGSALVKNVVASSGLNGIDIVGTSSDNVLLGNDVGLDENANHTSLANALDGILVSRGTGNTIGSATTAVGAINVISNNQGSGIHLGASSSSTVIVHSYVGTLASGASKLGNMQDGILIDGSSGNVVGGYADGYRNVIADNHQNGIHVSGSAATANLIAGNYIGVDFTGANYDGNFAAGVFLDGAGGNTISGLLPPPPSAGVSATTSGVSVISGNLGDGVKIGGSLAASNVVSANLIGLNAAGTAPLSNGFSGVEIADAPGTLIGGPAVGQGNVISGNGLIYTTGNANTMSASGVLVTGAGSSGTLIQSNRIGTTSDGKLSAGNLGDGIHVQGTSAVTIRGNVISGNGQATAGQSAGVHLIGPGTVGILIAGNLIGTDFTGKLAVGNAQDGVLIESGASGNTLGGLTATDRNIISGNNQPVAAIMGTGPNGYASGGVHLLGGATGNLVVGNFVGLDVDGAVALPNRQDGVLIGQGATGNTIGGTGAGATNVISGNNYNGIHITDATTANNAIQGNFIGTDLSGTTIQDLNHKSLGNANDGIWIVNAPSVTIGGEAAEARNVISGNAGNGIQVGDSSGEISSSAAGAVILNNLIGVDKTGGVSLGNALDGIFVVNLKAAPSASGTAVPASMQVLGNVISGNVQDGILAVNSSELLVLGNKIGTDASGTLPLGNVADGLVLSHTDASTIGGTTDVAANVISGNFQAGLRLDGSSNNVIANDRIGTDMTGSLDLGNRDSGVIIELGSAGNFVGGGYAGAGNLIYANVGSGVMIQGTSDGTTSGNVVQGNQIGAATATVVLHGVATAQDLGNRNDGVTILNARANAVSGSNIIVNNHVNGVQIAGTSSQNYVQDNRIGLDALNRRVANLADGVRIDGASGNVIGGVGQSTGLPAPNVISGNAVSGVDLLNGASGNLVQFNMVGLDSLGLNATDVLGNRLGNSSYGILISGGRSNTIGGMATVNGSAVIAGNLISGNRLYGVALLNGTSGDVLAGNFIGLDKFGSGVVANEQAGVFINQSGGNTIGGNSASSRNVISGNGGAGVQINGSPADHSGNLIAGDFIGTDASGNLPRGNKFDGVQITDSPNNIVGGTSPSYRDVISANLGAGVHIGGSGSTNNVVAGDYIGTDFTGIYGNASSGVSLGNQLDGVLIDSASFNLVGGLSPASRNIISNNIRDGVGINNSSSGNVVAANWIGLDALGINAQGNLGDGVYVSGSTGNQIGGAGLLGNVISRNFGNGVRLTGESSQGGANRVQGNFIGTTAYGAVATIFGVTIPAAAPNQLDGVLADSAVNDLIGGPGNGVGSTRSTLGNVISGNLGNGVHILNSTQGILVQGNDIGLDASGASLTANAVDGVFLDNSAAVMVSDNLISGNGQDGVDILAGPGGAAAAGHSVLHNRIGTDFSGTVRLGNSAAGVFVNNSSNNSIGGINAAVGVTPSAGNVISANASAGVVIFGTPSTGNQVLGNFIGTNAAGTAALGNAIGVYVLNTTKNTIGSDRVGGGNVISGNDQAGVQIEGTTSMYNQVEGNLIGSDATGSYLIKDSTNPEQDLNNDYGRQGFGVLVLNSPMNLIGPTLPTLPGFSQYSANPATLDPGAGKNVISGNVVGVQVFGIASSNNVIQGNYVGTDQSGMRPLSVSSTGQATGQTTAPAGNYTDGIYVNNSGQVTGSDTKSKGHNSILDNLLTGNGVNGIQIYGPQSINNVIELNYIGTDKTGGTSMLPSYVGSDGRTIVDGNQYGVLINGSSYNTIGAAGAGNLISGNRDTGIYLLGPNSATNSQTQGNNSTLNVIRANRIVRNGQFGVLEYNVPVGPPLENIIDITSKSGKNYFSGNAQDIRPFNGQTKPDTGAPQSNNPYRKKTRKTKKTATAKAAHPNRAPGFHPKKGGK